MNDHAQQLVFSLGDAVLAYEECRWWQKQRKRKCAQDLLKACNALSVEIVTGNNSEKDKTAMRSFLIPANELVYRLEQKFGLDVVHS